jgi:hypothetical protein
MQRSDEGLVDLHKALAVITVTVDLLAYDEQTIGQVATEFGLRLLHQ